MAEANDDYPAHMHTYEAFNKLVLFAALFVVLVLVSMALGLLANVPVLALLFAIGGTVALIVAAAVTG
jgi:hypothetical protein